MAKSETGGTLSLYRKTRRPGDKALAFCIYLAAALTVSHRPMEARSPSP